MTHPLVAQLRFARGEFMRGLEGLSDFDARKRLLPMNCISWNIGHLAWQEQNCWLYRAQDQMPFPQVREQFGYGRPACTPALDEVLADWQAITCQTDPWLDAVTNAVLLQHPMSKGAALPFTFGSLMLRVVAHYWYHTGENSAIRQMLGHTNLAEFVGDLDTLAPYRPE